MFGWFRKKSSDPASAFMGYVAANRPHWVIEQTQSGRLQFRFKSASGAVDADLSAARIGDMLSCIRQNSAEWNEACAKLLSVLDQASQPRRPLSLEADRKRILPRLVPEEYYQQLKRGHLPVARRLPELDLWLVCALDSENSVSFVTEQQLGELGIEEEQLHAIAVENLDTPQFGEVVRRVIRENALICYTSFDSYAAARLLLVPKYLDENGVIGAVIPDRDSLTMAPEPVNGDWNGLAKMAAEPTGDRPILNRPVRVTRAGFELR